MDLKKLFLKRQYAVAVAPRTKCQDLTKAQFHVIKNGLNFWVADPFPIEVDNILYIFGEMFFYSKNKGCIGYTKLVNGKFTPWKSVIEEQYHLSFPNLFYIKNKLFMCPEANESEEVYLYECLRFPDHWKKSDTILSRGKYVDTIFYRHENQLYGFTYDLACSKLCIFEMNEGQSTLSPIDIINAKPDFSRPAGRIFNDDLCAKNIIPTQIGIPTYGAGIVLNELTVNWPTASINPITRIYPTQLKVDKEKEYIGVHTLNFSTNYMVIDLKWYGFNALNLLFKFKRKFTGESKMIVNR